MDAKPVLYPLSQAHTYGRIAIQCEKTARFDAASKCHSEAVELLKQSAEKTSFVSTQESIQLQIEYHQRQQKIIILKKIQYEIKLRLLREKERQMEMAQKEIDAKEKEDTLQWAIYQKIDEADSLIDILNKRESKSSKDETTELSTSPGYNSGTKHPKNDNTVIEELHTLNNKLRELITQLLNELEESQREAAMLKEKVKYYETVYPKNEVIEEQNLIDFNSLCSSGESIGIIS